MKFDNDNPLGSWNNWFLVDVFAFDDDDCFCVQENNFDELIIKSQYEISPREGLIVDFYLLSGPPPI